MSQDRMLMHTFAVLPRVTVLLAAALCLAACARSEAPPSADTADTADAPDSAELNAAACTEARGELAELSSVTSGMRPFAGASLRSQYLEQLAVEKAAPESVRNDLVQWKAQVENRQQALRDLPPRYENGRLLEPDTAALDRQFNSSMQPVGERLGNWVADACGGPGRATATASAPHLPLQSAHFPG